MSALTLKRFLSLSIFFVLLICTPITAAEPASEGRFVITIEDECMLVDFDGNIVVESGKYDRLVTIYPEFSDLDPTHFGALRINDDDSYGYALMNSSGDILTGFDYSSIDEIEPGIFKVYADGKYGIIDGEGASILPLEYTEIVRSGDGYLALRTEPYDDVPDGIYYINKGGEESATGAKVSYGIYGAGDGMLPAYDQNVQLYGYLDSEGRWAIDPQYTWAGSFNRGVAEAAVQTGTGAINKEGNWVITPKYTSVDVGYGSYDMPIIASNNSLSVTVYDRETLAVVAEASGKSVYGYAGSNGYMVLSVDEVQTLYTTDGKKLFSAEEDEIINIWQVSDSVIVSDYDNNSKICDLNGDVLSGPYKSLSNIYSDSGKDLYLFSEYESEKVYFGEDVNKDYYMSIDEDTVRRGLAAKDGRIVIEPIYDNMYELGDDRLFAETPGTYYILDFSGKIIKSFERYAQLID